MRQLQTGDPEVISKRRSQPFADSDSAPIGRLCGDGPKHMTLPIPKLRSVNEPPSAAGNARMLARSGNWMPHHMRGSDPASRSLIC